MYVFAKNDKSEDKIYLEQNIINADKDLHFCLRMSLFI